VKDLGFVDVAFYYGAGEDELALYGEFFGDEEFGWEVGVVTQVGDRRQ
jgi:hypothetical protein